MGGGGESYLIKKKKSNNSVDRRSLCVATLLCTGLKNQWPDSHPPLEVSSLAVIKMLILKKEKKK